MQLDDLIELVLTQSVSDLHLSVGEKPWVRVHGGLQTLDAPVCTKQQIQRWVEEKSGEEWIKLLSQQSEYNFSIQHPTGARLRVHLFLQQGQPSLSIRFFPTQIPFPDELHMPSILKELVHRSHGLILVTGPTGSGKSTTLAALIHYLNHTQSLRILTLEDPIEYLHPSDQSNIIQREIGMDVPSFDSGIRAALRQDPDVIMIGELRDLDTIQAAIRAAEAGRLVLATLHTHRAINAVHRLIDVFPAGQQSFIRSQLAAILLGVVSQRLIPRQDQQGRVAVFEVLVHTPAVANLIRTDQIHQIESLMQTGGTVGMQTMEMGWAQLVAKGWVNSVNKESTDFYYV